MHSNMGITDGVYGNLVRQDVHDTIWNLSEQKPASPDQDLQKMFEAMMKKYTKENPDNPPDPEEGGPEPTKEPPNTEGGGPEPTK
jgi:hypothetical protein